ncbi:MAG TPA: transketolase [Miltoncostaeaceae bacterium]|nr:transketolase [Miltoncostaeaceae bacterium]
MPTDLAPPELVATTVRTLSIDAVQRAESGHPGAPMGLAQVGWTLWSRHMRHSPANPLWPGRDRFVLSAGHASMLLYALLHLSGYELPLEEIEAFRQLGSETPGHPERGDTPGVEITTGPLGQGFANAVGFALAERMLAARFNREGHEVVDHRTWFICSDGDLMEGISQEAASIAGHLGLGKLVGLYDDNRISLDGPIGLSFSEDVAGRFSATGWRVLNVADGNDAAELDRVLGQAADGDGRPTLVIVRTQIGFGAPTKADSSASHGSPLGPDEVAGAKRNYGWPEEPPFLVPDEVRAWAGALRERGREAEERWNRRMEAYREAHPEDAAELERRLRGELPAGWEQALPEFEAGGTIASRAASGQVINALAERIPELVQGAADLSSSTSTTIKAGGDVTRGDASGRNIRYGVREHAMGAITNALAAHGGLRPVCSTFLTFSDYMKNTIRLAALMRLPSVFVYTHDSVALGEDGPTHQPVEHLAALRAIPDLVVIRPADARETAAAWRIAMERHDGPTVLVLSRQGLPTVDWAADVARGAYVVRDGGDCILMGTGAEVHTAREAADLLAADGIAARVVSMPSWELFAAQDRAYRDQVLPPAMRARVAVEAAASLGWHRWVGLEGDVVAIDRFGASAPGAEVLRYLGITGETVAQAARDLLGR